MIIIRKIREIINERSLKEFLFFFNALSDLNDLPESTYLKCKDVWILEINLPSRRHIVDIVLPKGAKFEKNIYSTCEYGIAIIRFRRKTYIIHSNSNVQKLQKH